MSTASRVDVDGHQLEVEVTGTGHPAIVYVAGTGSGSRSSFAAVVEVLPDLDAAQVFYTRPGLLSHGRAGHGLAGPTSHRAVDDGLTDGGVAGDGPAGDGPARGGPTDGEDLSERPARSFTEAAAELRAVLAAAEVPAPYVLVGHSIGATIIEAFALSWPAEVAAVVLVDASSMEFNMASREYAEVVRDGDTGIPFDVVRGAADLAAGEPPDVPVFVVTSRPKRWLDIAEEDYAGVYSLTREDLDDRWQEAQVRLAARWNATQWTATVGGHQVQNDDPDLVAKAVLAAWTAAGR